jgi:Spy/CpxP family protein refolding chaperone
MKRSFQPAAWAIAAFSAISVAAWAQSSQPYSGMQDRQIKALSDQQIADLKAGRGMGLALAAELNGYPGPSHLLELSDQLGLTADQRSSVHEMFNEMKAETIPLGEALLDEEQQLDRLFAAKTISEQQLKTVTVAIGEAQGRLRNAHLSYHLRTRAILQPSQIRRYAELRGYSEQEQMHHQRNHE